VAVWQKALYNTVTTNARNCQPLSKQMYHVPAACPWVFGLTGVPLATKRWLNQYTDESYFTPGLRLRKK